MTEIQRQWIGDLREGDSVQSTYAVQSKEPLKSYRSRMGRYFFLDVSDRTGVMRLKFWGGNNCESTVKLYQEIGTGDVIFVTGTVVRDKFEDCVVISVDEGTNLLRRTEGPVDPTVFLPSGNGDREAQMSVVLGAVASVENRYLRSLLDSFFLDEKFRKSFMEAPSAMTHHHNYIGGNLEHVVGVLKVCELLCDIHSELDRDLLVTGALLHDIGKIETYNYNTVIEFSEMGRFIGHSIIGENIVSGKINGIPGFPKVLALKLRHMILKHMGSYEDNGVRGITIPEALALHMADNSDAQIKGMIQERQRGREHGGDWFYSRSFKGTLFLD
jgi:3'-5' exoribonuclease